MSKHDCQHEVDIALMSKGITELVTKTDEIHSTIIGNGKAGLKTEVAVAKASIRRLWVFLSTVLGMLIWVIKSG